MERIIVTVEIGVQTINLRNLARNETLPEEYRNLISPTLEALRTFPRLNLVPGLGRSIIGQFLPGHGNDGHDAAWLHHLLVGQAMQMKALFEEADDHLPTETRILVLQAIAAQQEIAEILTTHYIGRKDAAWQAATSRTPEAEG